MASRIPQLKGNELFRAIEHYFQVKMTNEDLASPERVMSSLRACLHSLQGLTQQQIDCAAEGEAHSSSEHPELFSGILNQIAFAKFVQGTLQNMGVQDFRYGDFLRPDPIRARKVFNAIVHFRMDGQRGIDVTLTKEKEMENRQKHMLDLQQMHANLTQHKEVLDADLAQQTQEAQQKHEENQTIEREMSIVERANNALVVEIENRKHQRTELDQLVKTRLKDYKINQNDANQKQKWVIDDPQKMRDIMAQFKKRRDEVMAKLSDIKDKSRKFLAVRDELALAIPDVKSIIATSKECKDLRRMIFEADRQLMQLKDQLARAQSQMDERQSKLDVLDRSRAHLFEKSQRTEEAYNERRGQLAEQLEQSRAVYAQAEAQRGRADGSVDEYKKQIMEWQARADETLRATDEDIARGERDYARVRDSVYKYMDAMRQVLRAELFQPESGMVTEDKVLGLNAE